MPCRNLHPVAQARGSLINAHPMSARTLALLDESFLLYGEPPSLPSSPTLWKHTMPSHEKLIALFRAFGEDNHEAFRRAAESIIAEELAANHHSLATQLQQMLRTRQPEARPTDARPSLTMVPRDRRNGESLIHLEESSVTASQVVLSGETRAKVSRLLDEHRRRAHLAQYGYRPKSQLLFWGPPGCGKTFTAHYVAHELGLPIGILRLSAVISSFLGDTASHLQRVFELAARTPMVLLLDEVDAVGKDRDDPNDVGELKRVVNGLLQAMDSFRPDCSVAIATSNHQYLLDPAIWRRFDDVIHFPPPGAADRARYLKLLLNGIRYEGSIPNLARVLTSLSYADVERVSIEAVKTMILEERSRLAPSDVMRQLRAFKTALATARTKTQRRPTGGKQR